MANDVPIGPFTCDFRLQRVRPPEIVREEKAGVEYISSGGYELAYETTLVFDDGARLPVKATVLGQGVRLMALHYSSGQPARARGWAQGSVQIMNESGLIIFQGLYFDVRLLWTLAGDEALTTTGAELEHWESAFGEGQYQGHFFSLRVDASRGSGDLSGQAVGFIE